MLPKKMNSGDKKWLTEKLDAIEAARGPKLVAIVCQKYAKAYEEAHNAEPVEHKKDNAARREANTRLRKYFDSLNIEAIEPPAVRYD